MRSIYNCYCRNNQAPEPTRGTGTSAAEQPRAPVPRVVQLCLGRQIKTILAALLLFMAAKNFAAAEDQPISISLERTACFGSCPSYVLTILADGSVTFEGRQYVKKKGLFKKSIKPSKLAPIFKKIEEIHFWELEDSYRIKKNPDGSFSMITDMPTQYVTVKTSTKSKRVEDYFGTPAGLGELEQLIDEIAGTSKWIGKPDEKQP